MDQAEFDAMTPEERTRYTAAHERYTDALHAMQSGIAYLMNHNQAMTAPKHLRVGINSGMVSDAALVKLLVAKGLITHVEIMEALAAEAELEKARYEIELHSHLGRSVTLA